MSSPNETPSAASNAPSSDAASAAARRISYYCHICQDFVTIAVAPDTTDEVLCPGCAQGFLEESEPGPAGADGAAAVNFDGGYHHMDDDDDDAQQQNVAFGEMLGQLLGAMQQQGQGGVGRAERGARGGGAVGRGEGGFGRGRGAGLLGGNVAPGDGGNTASGGMASVGPDGGQNAGQNNIMNMFLQQLLNNLGAAGGEFQFEIRPGDGNAGGGLAGLFTGAAGGVHGNVGDYAWGPNGLDEIVTQLLNQFDGGAAKPLTDAQIAQIPTVPHKVADKNLQCTTCFDDFKLDEPVRELPCRHIFHSDCIVPWLKQHNTCPICRKPVVEEDGSTDTTSQQAQTSQGTRPGFNPIVSQAVPAVGSIAQVLRPFLFANQTPPSTTSSTTPPTSTGTSSTPTNPPQGGTPPSTGGGGSGAPHTTMMDQIDELD